MVVPPAPPTLVLGDPSARDRLRQIFNGKLSIESSSTDPEQIRVVTPEALPREMPPGKTVALVGECELPALVALLRDHPWIDHVISRRSIEDDDVLPLVAGALWKVVTPSGRLRPFDGSFS